MIESSAARERAMACEGITAAKSPVPAATPLRVSNGFPGNIAFDYRTRKREKSTPRARVYPLQPGCGRTAEYVDGSTEGSINSRIVVRRIRRGFLRVRGRIGNRFQGRIGKRSRCRGGGRGGSGGGCPGPGPAPHTQQQRGPPPRQTTPAGDERNEPFSGPSTPK